MQLITRLKDIKYKNLDLFFILIIIVLSSYIRFVPIFNGDFPFLYDHGRDMIDVRKIVVDHDLALIGPTTGLQGLYHSPLHYYLLSIAFLVSGGNPASGVFMTALFAVFATVICFVAGKRIFGRVFGIAAAAFYALSPASISDTTMFWNPNWIPMAMVPFYFCLHKGIFSNKKYLIGTLFIAGIISQFEAAFGIFLIPTIGIIIGLYNRKLLISREVGVGFLLFMMTFLWFVAFEILHGYNMTKAILKMVSGMGNSLGESIPFMTRVIYRLNELERMTIYAFTWNNFAAILFFIAFLMVFVHALIKKNELAVRNFVFFGFVPISYFVWFLIFPFPAWSYYWIGLQVSYYFFAAYAVSYLYNQKNNLKYGAIVLVLIWLLLTVKLPGDTSYTDSQAGTYKNMLSIVDQIYKDGADEKFGVLVYTPPINTYAYDYIFWWRGRWYNYIPDNSKSGLYYLIIEPNEANRQAIVDWRKSNNIGDKLIWIKSFTGNVTIEKREAKEF